MTNEIRRAFAARSTGSERGYYYSNKSLAINAFDGELQGFDLCLRRLDLIDIVGDAGWKICEVLNEFSVCVGHAHLSWYRMPSGNWEFVGYIT